MSVMRIVQVVVVPLIIEGPLVYSVHIVSIVA